MQPSCHPWAWSCVYICTCTSVHGMCMFLCMWECACVCACVSADSLSFCRPLVLWLASDLLSLLCHPSFHASSVAELPRIISFPLVVLVLTPSSCGRLHQTSSGLQSCVAWVLVRQGCLQHPSILFSRLLPGYQSVSAEKPFSSPPFFSFPPYRVCKHRQFLWHFLTVSRAASTSLFWRTVPTPGAITYTWYSCESSL